MKKALFSQGIPFAGKQKSLLVVLICFFVSMGISVVYVYFWYFSNPDSFRNTLLQELQKTELSLVGKQRDVPLVSYDRQKQIRDYSANEIKIMKHKADLKGMGHQSGGNKKTLNREIKELESQNELLYGKVFSVQEFELSQQDRDQLFEITQKIEDFLKLKNFYGRLDEKDTEKFERYKTLLNERITLMYEIVMTHLSGDEIDVQELQSKKIQLRRGENTMNILKKNANDDVMILIENIDQNSDVLEVYEKLQSIYSELGDAPDIRQKEQYNMIVREEKLGEKITELEITLGDIYNGDTQYYETSLEELDTLRNTIQNFGGNPIVQEDPDLKKQSEVYYAIMKQDEIRKYIGKLGNPVYTFFLSMFAFFPLLIMLVIVSCVGRHQFRAYRRDKKKLSMINEEDIPDLQV